MCSNIVDHDYGLCLLLTLPLSEVSQLMTAVKTGHAITNYGRATVIHLYLIFIW